MDVPRTATTATEPKAIGLAISGGGHRATAFALGVLLYLVDTGLNRKVQTITSVSGGSILNAFIALIRSADGSEKPPFSSFSTDDFEEHAVKIASLLAGRRKLWFLCVAVASCSVVLATLLFLLNVVNGLPALVSLAVLLIGVSIWIGPKSGGSIWGWSGTWLYCSGMVWGATAVVVTARTLDFWGAAVAAIVVGGWLLQQRHRVAERAYEYTVCRSAAGVRGRASPCRLEDMNATVRHVFCATEMHSGQHAYFSHDFVYARGFGLGHPAGLPVATAVQVSANFPGGFPIRPLRASRFRFFLTDRFEDAVEQGVKMGRDILMPDEDVAWAAKHQQFPETRRLPGWLMLSDGGVFDNLAIDWYLESQMRVSRLRMPLNWDYGDGSWVDAATNARDEGILDPLRDSTDCLIVVNAGVTAHWSRAASAMVSLPFIGEVLGLSQISGTMYNNYTKDRIRMLREHLVIEMGFAERLVRTTLLPLGTDVTAGLLSAGYRHAMYVIRKRFGYPLLEVDDENFECLARGERGARSLKLSSLGG